jgi:catechol 2,3-dioxygenase
VALDRLRDAGVNILGAADHTVTRSLYIEDPDGNEIEQYIDAQPERWRGDPEVVVARPRAPRRATGRAACGSRQAMRRP